MGKTISKVYGWKRRCRLEGEKREIFSCKSKRKEEDLFCTENFS